MKPANTPPIRRTTIETPRNCRPRRRRRRAASAAMGSAIGVIGGGGGVGGGDGGGGVAPGGGGRLDTACSFNAFDVISVYVPPPHPKPAAVHHRGSPHRRGSMRPCWIASAGSAG